MKIKFEPPRKTCTCCGTHSTNAPNEQWWGLSNYYCISGTFCPQCFDKVSHDSYGKPNHPTVYSEVLNSQHTA